MTSAKSPKLLVAAAWEPELARFRAQVASAKSAGIEVVLETVGVGVVESAIAMTLCIVRHRPTGALLLGTCGAFGPAHAIGSVVTGSAASLADASVMDGLSALPPPMPAVASFDADLFHALEEAGAKSVHIANTVGITTDDELAARLGKNGEHHVEHLEAFAFARASAVAGLPCAVALGIANGVGARGRAEWLANHDRASDAAADVALRALGAIAANLLART